VYWRMVTHHTEDVANWHFSADPKPVENGLRDKTLQRQYHNQRRHAKRTRFDWWRHNGFEDWLFRDA